ncbi:taurine ABC transporter ATP-binding protein [Undibacterium terreum]|uniref:Taurine import ATP-binding protein TauB n=1 Tax=Undibacterium terreum TaxID=1224302 RepID=A0A916XK79_9BURK|nr:ATP-binding cassette domain-containing protein [Undibacterium terreum]GGC77389.1 taurine import ATP-binding protein TauB [Undibacterium terreum]
MIRVQSLTVAFDAADGKTEVLRDLSLDLPDGRFTVVIGESGCGKTTLLNVIAGFIAPTAGSVSIDGRLVSGPGADRGVVFQDDALLPWQSVLENISFGLRLQGLGKAEREARGRHYLSLVGLEKYADFPIWKISGGMRQRVGLARALAVDPRFLLLDEPLGALDALTRERMQEHLLRIWKTSGKGMFMITHSVEEALFLATDLVLLRARPGRVESIRRLDFSERFAAGESARSIKSDPRFVALREEILASLLRHEEHDEQEAQEVQEEQQELAA